MNQTVYFLDMFCGYTPPEELQSVISQAVVCHGEIDTQGRKVTANILFPAYVTKKQITSMEMDLEQALGIKRIILIPAFEPHLLSNMDFNDL